MGEWWRQPKAERLGRKGGESEGGGDWDGGRREGDAGKRCAREGERTERGE